MQLVRAADGAAADEDLRDAASPSGASGHLPPFGRVAADLDLDVIDALAL
jgi:hypothetical protein